MPNPSLEEPIPLGSAAHGKLDELLRNVYSVPSGTDVIAIPPSYLDITRNTAITIGQVVSEPPPDELRVHGSHATKERTDRPRSPPLHAKIPDIDSDSVCDWSPISWSSVDRDWSEKTDEICNTVLSAAFGTNLDELGAPTEAWKTVRYCLAELSNIVEQDDHKILESCGSRQACTSSTGSAARDRSYGGNSSINPSGREGPGKRKRDGTQGPDGGEGGGDEDTQGEGSSGAGGLLPEPSKQRCRQEFSCPFRKRNPLRFNVRSNLNCATQSFSSITLLK